MEIAILARTINDIFFTRDHLDKYLVMANEACDTLEYLYMR